MVASPKPVSTSNVHALTGDQFMILLAKLDAIASAGGGGGLLTEKQFVALLAATLIKRTTSVPSAGKIANVVNTARLIIQEVEDTTP